MSQPIPGSTLVGLLKDLGWKQRVLGEWLGVTAASVSQWKSGYRPVPTLHLRKLRQLLLDILQHQSLTAELQTRVAQQFDAWDQEIEAEQQTVAAEIQDLVAPLGVLMRKDVLSLTPEERAEMAEQCRRLWHLYGSLNVLQWGHPSKRLHGARGETNYLDNASRVS